MTDKTIEQRLDEFAETHGAVLLGMHKELGTLKQDATEQVGRAVSGVTTMISRFEQQQQRLSTRFDGQAAAAQAQFQAAHELYAKSDSLVRAFDAEVHKLVANQANELRRAFDVLARNEQKTRALIQEAKSLIAEHQKMSDRFIKITRRIALAALAIMIGLVIVYWRKW